MARSTHRRAVSSQTLLLALRATQEGHWPKKDIGLPFLAEFARLPKVFVRAS